MTALLESESDVVDALGELALFARCDRACLDTVAACVEGVVELRQGSLLCRQGDDPHSWWIVLEGTADVSVDGRFVGTIGPGEAIGEMALLDGGPVSATVVATSDLTAYAVSGAAFLETVERSSSLAIALLRETVGRLRRTNERAAVQLTRSAGETSGASDPDGDRPTKKPSWNALAPDYQADPYATFEQLREWAAATPSAFRQSWTLCRYDDVNRILRDRSITVELDSALSTPAIEAIRSAPEMPADVRRSMLRIDGQDHVRLRRLVSKAFTPRAIAEWEESVVSIVDRLLDAAAERGEFDVMADYALVLPCEVISSMLGMPVGDITQIRTWTNALTRSGDPLATQEDRDAGEAARGHLVDYLEQAIADKHDDLGDDVLSAMIRAEEDGDRLTHDELVNQVFLLYIAGHETTVYLIGNAVQALLDHPDQMWALRTDPTLDANAVEEFLRFVGPIVVVRRITTVDLDIDGTPVPAGGDLELLLAAANRDPRKFGPTAGVLDLARPDAGEHLAFATGAHYCLGASLARLEARVAIPRLVRRFPQITPLDHQPAWRNVVASRGLERLPVRVG